MMVYRHTILVACDDAAVLLKLLQKMEYDFAFPYEVITATRTADVVKLQRAVQADLLLLCVRQPEVAVLKVYDDVTFDQIPVLCLLPRSGAHVAAQRGIFFTCAADERCEAASFTNLIQSIFLMQGSARTRGMQPAALAERAQAQYQARQETSLGQCLLELEQKTEMLRRVRGTTTLLLAATDGYLRKELSSILSMLKPVLENHNAWGQLKLYFESSLPGFLDKLTYRFPSLTAIDLKYCCYLRINMANEDIRTLMCISTESVRTHQYRLKKKMCLTREEDLRGFLRHLG